MVGVEEGSFRKGDKLALLVAVIMRETRVDDVLFTYVTVDGLDAVDRLVDLLRRSGGSVDLILQHSIPYAGFNLMDPTRLHQELGVPVIVVNPEEPRPMAVRRALIHHFKDWRLRLRVLESVTPPKRIFLPDGSPLFLQPVGISESEAERIVRGLIVLGKRPEPLRVARILARELSKSL